MIYVDKETYKLVHNGGSVRVVINVFNEPGMTMPALIAPGEFRIIPWSIRVRDLLYIINSDVHIFERGCPTPKLKIPNGLNEKYIDYIGECVLNSCIYEISTQDGHLNVFIEPVSKEEHNG